ncbi:UDP-4-amino-4,6-dideoxy-N-acetyl-beta-L-altrosamine transaminase [Gammaproteobacteria bacterium]|nr:UDP-4-amino-4,6-dideoxy-N-acetyl-beta-L-altrosamine transaminase [Gammaproteobacteria bacterium]
MISYGKQFIDQDDIDAVTAALKSDFITQGPIIKEFEDQLSKKVNSRYALAFNSATSALHVGCLSLGLGQNDILWTVPNSFVASANCALYCNAKIDFVDINQDTYNVDIHELEKKLKKAKILNNLPKIFIPVHFSGQPTNQEKIWKLSQEFGFKILEDASHSLGATRNDEPVGSCKWSDMAVLSFHAVKMITTGEGGALVTSDNNLYTSASSFRSHGVTRERNLLIDQGQLPFYYEQQQLGFNYRITDIASALGISQLKKLKKFVETRQKIASNYFSELSDTDLKLPTIEVENKSSFHLFVVQFPKSILQKISMKKVYHSLLADGINTNLHYYPIHLQPYYQALGFSRGDFPVAENYAESSLSIPMYVGLSESDQAQVIDALKKLYA